MTSTKGYTAKEVVKWSKDHDIFHGMDLVDRQLLKSYTLKQCGEPTFTTVCCFAQETGQYEAVKRACHAFTEDRAKKPNFHKLLGGDGSRFGGYCAELVKTTMCPYLVARDCL